MISVVSIVLFAAAANAAVDCMKKPDFSINAAGTCCKIQEPNKAAFPVVCLKHLIGLNIPISACFHECVFNETKILQNGKFQVSNIRPFVAKIFTENITLHYSILAYEKCAISSNKEIAKRKSNPFRRKSSKLRSTQYCSPLSLNYGMCAFKELFVNCPAVYWTASSTCELIREYLNNCDAPYTSRKKSIRNQFVRI